MTGTDDWNVYDYWILYNFSDLGNKLDFLFFIDFFHAVPAFYHSCHTKTQFYKKNDVIERWGV